ncbi:hypothetical protein [Massilia violaceinigra]|uniref:hypothetical protein n=1 Tax=Massilia violaceinigra TaxID=2045208 RepID=UPI0012FD02BC|nr:hypothetical protein [Massilia violaceinigra]
MRLRTLLFIGLSTAHALVAWIWAGTSTIGPAIAATIYGPLFVLDAIKLPVFGGWPSGGWAAPSLLGWACVVLFWAAIWWGVAVLLVRPCRR